MNDYLGVPLKEFAKGRTQPQIADFLGVTQGAISQMLSSGRDIRVKEYKDGTFQAFEIRSIGRRDKPADRRSGERRQGERRA